MTKVQLTSPEHEVCYQDLCALVTKHSAKLTAIEVLAVAANMVGKIAAMQDQRTCSIGLAREIIAKNLERGNRQVIETLANKTAGSA